MAFMLHNTMNNEHAIHQSLMVFILMFPHVSSCELLEKKAASGPFPHQLWKLCLTLTHNGVPAVVSSHQVLTPNNRVYISFKQVLSVRHFIRFRWRHTLPEMPRSVQDFFFSDNLIFLANFLIFNSFAQKFAQMTDSI